MKNDVVDAIIEIPYRSRNKYEVDKDTGRVRLDRVLYSAMGYPAEYGYLEQTLAPDGDPLDILLLCSEALEPLILCRAYPIGYISMIDNGKNDEKIIAIPFSDPMYNQYTDINQLPTHIFDEMKHFFSVYKNLEGKTTAVNEVMGREEAIKVIKKALADYKAKFVK